MMGCGKTVSYTHLARKIPEHPERFGQWHDANARILQDRRLSHDIGWEEDVYKRQVRNWMGHSSIDTTNIYAEISMERKLEALKK